MGFKEALHNLGERIRQKKSMQKEMENQVRIQKSIEAKQKSANERELEGYMDEEREEQIKESLEYHRKKREKDIALGHNPLDVKNITDHTEWNVMKEKNQFANNKNMFSNQKNIFVNNPTINKVKKIVGESSNTMFRKSRGTIWN